MAAKREVVESFHSDTGTIKYPLLHIYRMASRLADMFSRQLGLRPRVAGREELGLDLKIGGGGGGGFVASVRPAAEQKTHGCGGQYDHGPSQETLPHTVGTGRDANKLETIRFVYTRDSIAETCSGTVHRFGGDGSMPQGHVHCLTLDLISTTKRRWKNRFRGSPVARDSDVMYFWLKPYTYDISIVLNEGESWKF